MTHIKFCDCLKQLLTDLGISSSRLAKAINVDSSLVNRWINGRRIPAYHTAHIENIADYLCKNIHNTFQEQQILTLTADVCGSIILTETLNHQIQYLLQEAQGYSLECAQEEKANVKNDSFVTPDSTATPDRNHYIPLSDSDRLLTDQFQIIKACLSLLDNALSIKSKRPRTIYIVYDNHFFPDLWTSNNIDNFLNKLQMATHNGFHITLLLRLNYDTEHTVRMIEFAKPFLLKGTLTLYHAPQFGYPLPEQGLLLVPDVGLISGLSNEFLTSYHYAFYLTRPAVLSLCQSHLELFLKDHASLLLTKHHIPNNNFINIPQIEQSNGCHFLFRYFFGMMTFPPTLYRKLLNRLHFTEEENEKSMILYQKRQTAFLHNIQYYQHFDIYAASCVDELVNTHQTFFFSHKGARLVPLKTADIIEHLQYIIYLLRTYDNYQIAFYQPTVPEDLSMKNVYCLVKERHSVLFELLHPTDSTGNLRFYSEEPMLTSGFYAYLENIWQQIPPVNKSKSDVIDWLSGMICVVQERSEETTFLSKV